ncbi:MAG: hypothetical protein AAFY71_17310 [Bacteroidota bacterium]
MGVKSIEYIYLLLVFVGIAFLAIEFGEMNNITRVLATFGVGIMAFMYSFRRNSRIALEKKLEEMEEEEASTNE